MIAINRHAFAISKVASTQNFEHDINLLSVTKR